MSNYKIRKSDPPKSQGFQHTEIHCWVTQSLNRRLMPEMMGFLFRPLYDPDSLGLLEARNKIEIIILY